MFKFESTEHPEFIQEEGRKFHITKSTSSTVFCSPPFSSIEGNPSVRLEMRGNDVYTYVGAAPPNCNQSKDLSTAGLAFAKDGTLRLYGKKKKSSDSKRKFAAEVWS